MKLRFTGQHATVFHGVGELVPDEVREFPAELAKALLHRGEFEVVVPSNKRAGARKLEENKTTGKPLMEVRASNDR